MIIKLLVDPIIEIDPVDRLECGKHLVCHDGYLELYKSSDRQPVWTAPHIVGIMRSGAMANNHQFVL